MTIVKKLHQLTPNHATNNPTIQSFDWRDKKWNPFQKIIIFFKMQWYLHKTAIERFLYNFFIISLRGCLDNIAPAFPTTSKDKTSRTWNSDLWITRSPSLLLHQPGATTNFASETRQRGGLVTDEWAMATAEWIDSIPPSFLPPSSSFLPFLSCQR